jgi:hypothetical protein
MNRLLTIALAALMPALVTSMCGITHAQQFLVDSGVQKKTDGNTWRISVKELERLPRVSVVEVTTDGRPQSVGGSMFIGCAVVQLARERDWRYVAQTRSTGVMQIGGLKNLNDDPEKSLGADFANVDAKKSIDIEKMGWLCDFFSKKEAPIINGQ